VGNDTDLYRLITNFTYLIMDVLALLKLCPRFTRGLKVSREWVTISRIK
jgi:hypothetical protein